MRTGQRVAQIVAALLMAFVGVLGSYDLPNEWRGATTPWQHTVSIAVALYGVLGIAGAVGLILRKQWSYACAIGWAVACVYAGTVAVIAYGGAPLSGVLGALIGAGAIGALVVWLTRVALREQTPVA
jgi:hypothetical protein